MGKFIPVLSLGQSQNDPNYQQVSAYVDKNLAIRFKQLIASKSLNISEGLEEALQAYLDAEQTKDATEKQIEP